jgi:hypothetical protein
MSTLGQFYTEIRQLSNGHVCLFSFPKIIANRINFFVLGGTDSLESFKFVRNLKKTAFCHPKFSLGPNTTLHFMCYRFMGSLVSI